VTVATNTRIAGPFAGNGVTVAFPFTFRTMAATDVTVTALTAGVETAKANPADFTVVLNADQDAAPGGTVTAVVAPPVGTSWYVSSDTDPTQAVVVTNGGGFFPSVFNSVFDRVTVFAQELRALMRRAPKLPLTSGLTNIVFPVAANGILAWNAAGTALTADPNAATAAQAGHAGEVLTTDGATSSWTGVLAQFRISTKLGFGTGFTAANPMLKPNGTQLEVRLGDDSATTLLRASGFVADAGGAISFSTRSQLQSLTDGYLTMFNAAGTGFTGLRFGGVTNAFPMAKRNGTGLDFRLADDSAACSITTANITLGAGNQILFTGRGRLDPVGDGVITLYDNATTSFGRIQFGGTTNAFPALARSGNGLSAVYADNSGATSMSADAFTASGSGYYFTGVGSIRPSANGILKLLDSAGTSFGRLCFGDATAAFPALKRSAAALVCRLGDDTGDADFYANSVVSTGFSFYLGTTRGTFGADADGRFLMRNAAGTGFTALAFGGTTNAFPEIKRNGTALQARLADDSDDAPITTLTVKTKSVTLAQLNAYFSAATAGAGTRALVNDSNATLAAGLGNTVVGGGANIVPVFSDGANWKIG
jgi:hypothetical protein